MGRIYKGLAKDADRADYYEYLTKKSMKDPCSLRLTMRSFVFSVVLVAVVGVQAHGQLNRTHFYGEDAFASNIQLTKSMLKGLRKDKDFDSCYEGLQGVVEATRIDANGDGKPEVLVKVECGNSATSYLFWLLVLERDRYRPIFTTGTMGIDFMKRRRKGFRDISAQGCNANTCFFEYFAHNGRRYVRTRHWSRPNN